MPRLSSKSDKQNTELLKRIAYPVMAALGALIFLYLTYQSFFYTQYIAISWKEMPTNVKDQPLWNVAALLAFAGASFLLWMLEEKLRKKCLEKVTKRIELLTVVIAVLWMIGIGIWWITALDRVPEGDQAFIYGGASYFIEGRYFFFGHGCYCQIYPQQLGQIAVVELLFRIVGTYNYFAVQILCVFFAAGILLFGYLILRSLKAGFVVKMLYLLLMMGCLPMIGYTSWVYGDLPSTFFLFVSFFLILRLQENPKWYLLAGTVGAFTMACLVRKNSYVFLVAVVIMAVIDAISHKRWRMLIAAALMFLVPFLCYQGIYAMYEARSGKEIEAGLPVNSWIVMGMQENWNGNGWYNDYPKQVGASLDWDYDAVREQMREYLKVRISEFRTQPAYAVQFYKAKVLSQWNEPLFQSLFFSQNYQKEEPPKAGSFLADVYQNGKAFTGLLFWADRWHFLIFFGLLCYFVFCVRRDGEPMSHLFALTILGGFFFSILWEAKARYVLPYYLMAYPLAVLGFAGATKWAVTIFKSFGKRSAQ